MMNRWLVVGVWAGAVLALVSASTKGAFGVAAVWAIPAALAVTVAGMGWPDKPVAKVVGVIGVVWQVALIGAYWPFAARAAASIDSVPMAWPAHVIVILVVLAVLAMSFVALFLIPALSLRGQVRRATHVLSAQSADMLDKVADVFRADAALGRLWQEYRGQVRNIADADGRSRACAHLSARAVFDPATVTHSRLRLEFFRNLPGVFTGTGIIGTFTGLIMGLRSFHISQDPSVVQRSLEALLSGVWEAFLVSAVAIALAILVTVIEKLTMSAVYRQLDELAIALDGLYPPRPQPEDEAAWMPQLIEALTSIRQTAPRPAYAMAMEPAPSMAPHAQVPMTPMTPIPAQAAMQSAPALQAVAAAAQAAAPVLPDLHHALLDTTAQSRAALTAMTELARGLPELMAGHMQVAAQGQMQASQALKALSARLEGVASSIELSGRKTLETVAARLMQSEMNMVSRHHAVADHLGELVQRIEALCGLLQQDRADLLHQQPDEDFSGHEPPGYATRWGTAGPDESQRAGRSGANWNNLPSGNGHAHASSYPAAGDGDAWPEHQSRTEGGFGS